MTKRTGNQIFHSSQGVKMTFVQWKSRQLFNQRLMINHQRWPNFSQGAKLCSRLSRTTPPWPRTPWRGGRMGAWKDREREGWIISPITFMAMIFMRAWCWQRGNFSTSQHYSDSRPTPPTPLPPHFNLQYQTCMWVHAVSLHRECTQNDINPYNTITLDK